jgi:hypothetical protein
MGAETYAAVRAKHASFRIVSRSSGEVRWNTGDALIRIASSRFAASGRGSCPLACGVLSLIALRTFDKMDSMVLLHFVCIQCIGIFHYPPGIDEAQMTSGGAREFRDSEFGLEINGGCGKREGKVYLVSPDDLTWKVMGGSSVGALSSDMVRT